MNKWQPVLTLNNKRQVTDGNHEQLRKALNNAADLRIYTEFIYGEHIDPSSPNKELVQEVSDFRVTYNIDNRWSAGIMSLRVPAQPPEGFGPRISMSFFMYNEDGSQAIARPYLDSVKIGPKGPSPLDDHSDMPKYHQLDNWDAQTNAPSSNFIYDFEKYQFLVCDSWKQVYSHDAQGRPLSGSLDALIDCFVKGYEIKVGIAGLCSDMLAHGDDIYHELFVQAGPGYYNTEQKLFTVETQPIVRLRPALPMRYTSGGWDFGWLLLRTDGFVARWLCDPYTLAFHKSQTSHVLRWFVR